MAENSDNKDSGATVRVPEWVLDEIEAELAKMPRPRPTRGDLLAEAWKAWKGQAPPGADADQDVERLLELKRIGSPEDIEGIQTNIHVFWRDARRTLAARKRKGA